MVYLRNHHNAIVRNSTCFLLRWSFCPITIIFSKWDFRVSSSIGPCSCWNKCLALPCVTYGDNFLIRRLLETYNLKKYYNNFFVSQQEKKDERIYFWNASQRRFINLRRSRIISTISTIPTGSIYYKFIAFLTFFRIVECTLQILTRSVT